MIESPKNFIEQFQNFIEHIAGVMKGLVSAKEAQTFTTAEKKQARDNIEAVSLNDLSNQFNNKINLTGDRGQLAGYEGSSTQTSLTVGASSPDSIWYNSTTPITVQNGLGSQAWIKTITLNQVPSVNLGTNWSWVNGETPTLKVNGTLVLSWNNTRGIAAFLSPSA